MFKEIEVPEFTKYDETGVTLVRPGYKEKYASVCLPDKIYKELEDFKGKPNKSYMLVVAVSPCEYWGDNKNNDAFEEYWLKKKHSTFTTHGTFFKNHVNKDPSNNYGDNELSWYDDKMKRTLVLVGVDHDKAPDIVNDVENGRKVSVSMGCRIAHDVCSICGHKAPTTSDYCKHMQLQKGKILKDGRKVFVYNPDPVFFDLSNVIRPAGHIEYIIKVIKPKEEIEKLGEIWLPKSCEGLSKVASKESDDLSDKKARLNKLCVMNKIVEGEPVTEDEMDPKLRNAVEKSKDILSISSPEDIEDEDISKLSSHPLKKIFSTANVLGITFKPSEMCKLVIKKFKHPDIQDILEKLEDVGFNPLESMSENPMQYMKKRPKVLKIVIKSGNFDNLGEDIDDKVMSILGNYFEKRSSYIPMVEKRVFSMKSAGALSTIPAYDASGSEYITTQEAIDRAGELNLAKNLAKGVGLAGLLGTSLYVGKNLPLIGGKYMAPAAILGALWAGRNINRSLDPDQLSTIPPHTVLQKVSSLEDINKIDKVAYDDQDLIYSSMPGMYERDWMDKVTDWSSGNPELATLLGLVTAGSAVKGGVGISNIVNKLGKGFKNLIQSKGKYFVDPVKKIQRKGLSKYFNI